MPATELTVEKSSLEGLDPTHNSANADGNFFQNSGKEILIIKNGDASAHTATIASADDCNQGFTHNVEITVPAGEERVVGPFKQKRFNTSGQASITYDDVTSVTVAVVQVPES